ncbi:MAG: hypothetical protein GY816_23535 [Cytophagales bacterium]|nr:hypothetical protein [Cytophagales bacterium]
MELISRWQELSIICLVSFILLHVLFRSKPIRKQIAISHRGAASLSPENTIASVQKAIEQGATYIEVDVQRTQDQILVLLHDKTIDRTTSGTGKVGSLDWGVVENANTDYPIPKLEELLALIEPTEVSLILELKHPSLYPGIESQTVALIEEYQLNERVIIVSFDLNSLQKISKIKDDIELGQLYFQGVYMPKVKDASIVDVFWFVPLIDPTFIWRHHRNGRQVWVWTIDSATMMKFMLWLGVDGITTNYPQRWPLEN